VDAKDTVMGAFFALTVARSLQVNRSVDVMSVRQFIGGNERCNHKMAAMFKKMAEAGAVEGVDSGRKDEKGYPYKRWILTDAEKVKDVLRKWHVKPMRPNVIESWRALP
jgi:hypothetical protein